MGGINAMDLFTNQTNFLTVGHEKKITLWDLRQSNAARLAAYNSNPVDFVTTIGPSNPQQSTYGTTLALSHDNLHFATGGTDQVVRLWDTQRFLSGKDPQQSSSSSSRHAEARSQPDAPQYVSSSSVLGVGLGHSGVVTSVAWTPDDRQVVSGGTDSAIFLWNIFSEDS